MMSHLFAKNVDSQSKSSNSKNVSNTYIREIIIMGAVDHDNAELFRKYVLLLRFDESEIEELRQYIRDEKPYRGLYNTSEKTVTSFQI